MPLYALIDGVMTRADRGGPRAAECFECAQPMVAKTGDVITWHWAHRAENPDCRLHGESEWHLAWKALGLDGTQEITREDGKRRADVLAPSGFAVEFQNSPMSWREVRGREQDWDHQLVWVYNGIGAVRTKNIDMAAGSGMLRWWRCPATLSAMVPKSTSWPGCRTFIDLGDTLGLFYAEARFPVFRGPDDIAGHKFTGMLVSREAFIRNVLHGAGTRATAAMMLAPELWQPWPEPVTLVSEDDAAEDLWAS